MTQEDIAKVINPEHPWVYAPTTAPTKVVLKNGSVKLGFFNYTRRSGELEKENRLTFLEFGVNVQNYKSTGDEGYVTVIDANDIISVEYPAREPENISLKSLIGNVENLLKQRSQEILTTENLVRLSSQFQLDWGIEAPANFSADYSVGATKQILIEGLAEKNSSLSNRFPKYTSNRFISLASNFFKDNLLTKEFIVAFYRAIFETDGKFRALDATVHQRIKSDFTFLSPSQIEDALEGLSNWYKENSDTDFHPLLLAAMFHYQFVAIHPFADGNGRTARILTSLILLRNKIPPPSIPWKERIFYLDALQRADAGDLETWLKFFGLRVINAMESMFFNNAR
ncbi:MAG: Fic family protein [Agriterribacter sp.]